MKRLSLLLATACLAVAGCKKQESAPQSTNAASGGNPITAPADYLGAVVKGKISAEKTVETAGLNQTIQLFYAQEGKYPKTLHELLAPGYLRQLPQPPVGMKFDYDATSGTLKVVPK